MQSMWLNQSFSKTYYQTFFWLTEKNQSICLTPTGFEFVFFAAFHFTVLEAVVVAY